MCVYCEEGDFESLEFLIKKNSQMINLKNHQSLTLLAIATKSNFFELAKFLLSQGADPNSTNNVKYFNFSL
jgi:ankyrin repeat protein